MTGEGLAQARLRIKIRAGGDFQKAHPDQLFRAPAKSGRQPIVDHGEAVAGVRAPDEAGAAGRDCGRGLIDALRFKGGGFKRLLRLRRGRGRRERGCVRCRYEQRSAVLRAPRQSAAQEDKRYRLAVDGEAQALKPRRSAGAQV